MTNQHPITPPPELVEEWIAQVWHEGTPVQVSASDLHLASKAAEWGARYGHQPAPAAEGEVRGLVAELQSTASGLESQSYPQTAALITRAAELLQQQHPTPVPVSERLPGPGDLNDKGWCWVLYRGFATWALEPPLGQDGKPTGYTHWLPAHALPLPQGEVEG